MPPCHMLWNNLSTAHDGSEQEAESLPVRRQRHISKWDTYLTNLYGATSWFWRWFRTCLPIDQVHLWPKAGRMSLEYWVQLCNLKAQFLPAYFRSLHLHLVPRWSFHHCHCLGGWPTIIHDAGESNWADKGEFGSWMETYWFRRAGEDCRDRDHVTQLFCHNLLAVLSRIHPVERKDGYSKHCWNAAWSKHCAWAKPGWRC